MSLVLSESLVLAKTRSQDLKSVLKLNCWGSGIKDVSLVRQMINVEVIGLSCNEVTSLEDFAYCPKLRELILRKNQIKNISEVAHLQGLPKLTSLWLGENPCAENTHNYRKVVLKALPNLTVLDNQPVSKEELQEIEELGNEIYEEIPYDSVNSSSSGHSSSTAAPAAKPNNHHQMDTQQQQETQPHQESQDFNNGTEHCQSNSNNNNSIADTGFYQQPNETITSMGQDISSMSHQLTERANITNQLNDSQYTTASTSHLSSKTPLRTPRGLSNHCSSSNGAQYISGWSNNNNSMLPKGAMTMPECNSQVCANGRARGEMRLAASGGNKDGSDIPTTVSVLSQTKSSPSTDGQQIEESRREGEHYWRAQYESLLEDYNRIQRLNDKLEDKLLNIVEECERNKQECVANVEYEKSTLMADVNKLSTKLVDARIRLHDYEEKELLHAAECSSPCHRGVPKQPNTVIKDPAYDPNLV